MQRSPRLRAALLSLILFAIFLVIWQVATVPRSNGAKLDPAYARLVGAAATTSNSGLPTPSEVGAVVLRHLADPSSIAVRNNKGIGIQLGFSIARVLLGFVLRRWSPCRSAFSSACRR